MWLSIKAGLVSCGLIFASIPNNPNLPPIERPVVPKLPDFFPIDEEVNSILTLKVIDRESKINLSFSVQELEDKKYLYSYTVTNAGEYTVCFRYGIFDKIAGAESMMLILEKGQSRTITLESSKIPVYSKSGVEMWLMVKPDDKLWADDIKKAGATISGTFFAPVGGTLRGPLPIGME